MRGRFRALLPRLHVLPALSEQLDQWAEWLVRTRFAGRSEQELAEMFADLATFRDTVLGNAELQSPETVVDVGAGTGLLTVAASEQVAPDGDVLAVDVSADALEELRRIATAPNISYFIGTADVLPMPDESVDAVVTRSVLIYVDDKAEAAREFFRVLRGGGRISIFEPINSRNQRLTELIDFGDLDERVTEWEQRTYWNADDPMLNFDERDLQDAFRDAGFVDVQSDLRPSEGDIPPDRTLNAVGAPGRLSLLGTWEKEFRPEEVERLAAAVRAAGTIHRVWPAVYLTAKKL